MLSRKAAAMAFCASLMALAPVVDLSLATSAAAQTAVPTQAQVMARLRAAITAVQAAPGFSDLTPAAQGPLLVAGVRDVIAAVLAEGATSASISGAMAQLVSEGVITAALAYAGIAAGLALAAANGVMVPTDLLAMFEAATGFDPSGGGPAGIGSGGPTGFSAPASFGGGGLGGSFDPCAGNVGTYC